MDVNVVLSNGIVSTDLYSKPTDKHQYLFHTSCHPNSCKKGIPFGQALRIRRICSTNAFFEKRARELCNYLVKRGYKKDHVEREIDRARRIPRADTLRDKQPANNSRIPLSGTAQYRVDYFCSKLIKTLPVSHYTGADSGFQEA